MIEVKEVAEMEGGYFDNQQFSWEQISVSRARSLLASNSFAYLSEFLFMRSPLTFSRLLKLKKMGNLQILPALHLAAKRLDEPRSRRSVGQFLLLPVTTHLFISVLTRG